MLYLALLIDVMNIQQSSPIERYPSSNLSILQAQSLPEIAAPMLDYLRFLIPSPEIAIVFFDFAQEQVLAFWTQPPARSLELADFDMPQLLRQESVIVCLAAVCYTCIPIALQGDLMGAILTHQSALNHQADEAAAILAEVALQVAVAVQQLRLRMATERHLRELTVLHAVVRAGSEATTETELMARAVGVIRDKLYPDYFEIFLLDETGDYLQPYGVTGTLCRLSLSDCLEGQVMRHGRTINIGSASAAEARQVGMVSKLCVPLKVGERLIGLVVAEGARPNQFDEADVWFVSTFARQLATAVDRLRVEAMERQRTRQMAALNKIGQTITASLDLREVLQRIVEAIPPLVNADGGAVLLLEDEALVYAAVSGAPMFGLRGQRVVNNRVLFERPLLLQNVVEEIGGMGVNGRSLIAIPLQIGSEIIGVLQAVHQQPRAFSQSDLQILERTAPWVSIAIENARLHHQVQRHAVELEERVQQRTRELQETNDELSQYAYAVSHDLRTPLRGIRNYADFLQEDLADTLEDEQKRYLDGLLRAVREADHMVDGLLTLSRISSRDLPLESIDLNIFLRGLIASLELPADVHIIMQTDWPTIQTEVALLRQIFQNIILNGAKFNQSSVKEITLNWVLGEDQTYQFSIHDNGIGIDPIYQERIFGVFERLHTYQEYSGTGIGLAIVRKAVRKLRGSVRIESQLGQGSTFIVQLPVQ